MRAAGRVFETLLAVVMTPILFAIVLVKLIAAFGLAFAIYVLDIWSAE